MTDLADWNRTRTTPFTHDELLRLRERSRLLAEAEPNHLLKDALHHLSAVAGTAMRYTPKGD